MTNLIPQINLANVKTDFNKPQKTVSAQNLNSESKKLFTTFELLNMPTSNMLAQYVINAHRLTSDASKPPSGPISTATDEGGELSARLLRLLPPSSQATSRISALTCKSA